MNHSSLYLRHVIVIAAFLALASPSQATDTATLLSAPSVSTRTYFSGPAGVFVNDQQNGSGAAGLVLTSQSSIPVGSSIYTADATVDQGALGTSSVVTSSGSVASHSYPFGNFFYSHSQESNLYEFNNYTEPLLVHISITVVSSETSNLNGSMSTSLGISRSFVPPLLSVAYADDQNVTDEFLLIVPPIGSNPFLNRWRVSVGQTAQAGSPCCNGRVSGTAQGSYAVTMTVSLCGDGIIEGAEQCDDDGTTSGDGCSELCQVESESTCMGEPSVCGPTPPSVAFLSDRGIAILWTLLVVVGLHRLRRRDPDSAALEV